MKRQQRGYTVVEVLVVLVILAVIATIMYVGYSATQARAVMSDKRATADFMKQRLERYRLKNGMYPSGTAAFIADKEGFNDSNNGRITTVRSDRKKVIFLQSSAVTQTGLSTGVNDYNTTTYELGYWDSENKYWYAERAVYQPGVFTATSQTFTRYRCGTGSSVPVTLATSCIVL